MPNRLEQIDPSPRTTAALANDAGLPVAETFTSIQGEGKLTGQPSHFIRLSGCNLRCRWCDTPYASWNPEGNRRSIDEIVSGAVEASGGGQGVRHVVLTGGEPMMFGPAAVLTRRLREAGFHITVETAGTIFRPPSELACDLMSISPKLSNSTPLEGDARDPGGQWRKRHEQRRIDLSALQSLLDAYPERQLKFVVQSAQDVGEIESLLGSLRGWSPSDVMLMPEGVVVPDAAQTRWIVEACIERGWRLCPRLHIQLFGNKRGT